MKKRLLAILMASAMCLSLLAGCGGGTDAPAGNAPAGNEPSGDAPASGDTAAPESDKVFRLGFVNLADSDANCFQCQSVMKEIVQSDEFKEKVGAPQAVELYTADSDANIEKQTTNVETLLAKGIDALFLIGVDTDGNSAAVQACNDEGVPVFMVATEASEGEYKFIGFDEVALGEQQGKWCVDNLPENANICYLSGTPGREAAIMREQGFMDAIKSRTDLNIIGNQPANFMVEDAMQVTEDWIQKLGDQINCVVAQDNNSASGAVEALKAANMLDKVTVVGVITPGTWDADMVKNGEMDYGVYVGFKTLGELCAKVAEDFYTGTDIPERSLMEMYDITKDTYSQYFG